jgi:hypothetical protein
MNTELLIYRILSGYLRCHIAGQSCRIYSPTFEQKYEAEEVYQDTMIQCRFNSVLSAEDLIQVLLDRNLWSLRNQEELDKLPKYLEDLKLDLYQNFLRTSKQQRIRKELTKAKMRLVELVSKRGMYDHMSCEGVAELSKQYFFIYHNTRTDSGNIVPLLDSRLPEIIEMYIKNILGDDIIRSLVKTPQWRGVWGTQKDYLKSKCLTDEQQILISWSGVYDNIAEHMDAPSQDVIDDDDLCDGWIIFQSRKREKEKTQGQVRGAVGNSKIDRASEVFIMADTLEDAKKINSLNDTTANIKKKQRFNHIRKVGKVQEQHMPDVIQDLQMRAAQAAKEYVKRK